MSSQSLFTIQSAVCLANSGQCPTGFAQTSTEPLLRLQRSRAYLDVDSNALHGMGLWGVTFGNPGDVWHYPNSLSCLVVFADGKFVLEKREETTVGKPKIKQAEGTLGADDLQRLKAMLDDPDFRKIKSPPMPDLPPDSESIRELDALDAQVDREGGPQRFTTIKERVKKGAIVSATSPPSDGMDAYLDNGDQFKKQLNPLIKWFEGVEKKSKSDLKQAKPQYCAPLNIG